MTTKYCPGCSFIKPVEDFYKDKHTKDGYRYICKECIKPKNREEAQRRFARNRDVRLEQMRLYSSTNKSYRKYDSERNRLRSKIVITARRRARERNVENTLTYKEWKEILDFYGHQCAYCGGPDNTIDHIVPFAKGGPNTKENVVPACFQCNGEKGVQIWEPITKGNI